MFTGRFITLLTLLLQMAEIFHSEVFFFLKRNVFSDQPISGTGTLCENLYSALFQFAKYKRYEVYILV